ncbi:MAG: glycosyl hydrolase, partial [Bacteroides sp.]|nr:glycosyl hydrolase [Bacteroides sp.]
MDSNISRLREGFVTPPIEARPRALWDWVDGNFQMEEITREMEEAVRMGMGGFDIWDVRSVVDEDSIMPAGPPFMGDESLEAICFAINEAERLGLDLGLIVASGWNAGGAWTLPEHQTMGLFSTEVVVSGPSHIHMELAFPELPEMAGKSGRQFKAMIPRQ